MAHSNEVVECSHRIFLSEDDAARAYGDYVQEHNLNPPLNANASGVLVAHERGFMYQGV